MQAVSMIIDNVYITPTGKIVNYGAGNKKSGLLEVIETQDLIFEETIRNNKDRLSPRLKELGLEKKSLTN